MRLKSRLNLRGEEGFFLIASLLLALVIWLMSNLSRIYSGVLSVPVKAECNIQGHANMSSNSAMVSARCRTNGYRLLQESTRKARRPVRVKFDRPDMRHDTGDRFFITGNAMNNYLQEIFGDKASVEAFVTDTLFFTFPAENHKKVPVNFNGDFSYRSQYMASAPLRLSPDSVTVYGEHENLYRYLSGCRDEELVTVRGYLEGMAEEEQEDEEEMERRREACMRVMGTIDRVMGKRRNA